MKKLDLISLADLTPEQFSRILSNAADMKRGRATGGAARPLEGKTVAMLFQKPSLRTRVSFDAGITQLGGHAIYLAPEEVGLGGREPTEDVARVLSRYVDGVVARVFAHRIVEHLARYATVPVINGLSDGEHPCQALADLQTIAERKDGLAGVTVAYVGDGNNVAVSLLLGAAMSGINMRVASPEGFEIPWQTVGQALSLASTTEARVDLFRDPQEAVHGADVVYTDVWTSMGQEDEAAKRRRAFQGYQVTPELLAKANPGAIFMHPLPAHHGEEVAVGLLDHPGSVVFDQAENRLHAQKALLSELIGGSVAS
jgi:ornithine carbamoyltransferase